MGAPPSGVPAVLFTADYRASTGPPQEVIGDNVVVHEGRLRVRATTAGSDHGFAVGDSLRDAVLQADLSLSEGSDDDFYGLFIRQAAADTYYAVAFSISGEVWVRATLGGQHLDVARGRLAPDLRWNRGLGAENRLQIVACGPSVTVIANGMVVTGLMVDPRCKEGFCGFFLHHGGGAARAELAASWMQARAVFPPADE